MADPKSEMCQCGHSRGEHNFGWIMDFCQTGGCRCSRFTVVKGTQMKSQPVAYRVKDFADGWILCHTLQQAEREATSGNLIQPLYAEERNG